MPGSDPRPEHQRLTAKLFPLPDLVMFPHVVQPLRLFEPRYIALLEAALAGDRLIAMALLREHWQGAYFDRPPIHSTVCLGRVISDSRLETGQYNILLAGLTRARVAHELSGNTPYRTADIELLPDVYNSTDAAARRQLQRQLLSALREFHPVSGAGEELWKRVLRDHVSLGVLTDVISFAVPLPLPAKQQLLDCQVVEQRAQLLIEQLRLRREAAAAEQSPPFPPPFSNN